MLCALMVVACLIVAVVAARRRFRHGVPGVAGKPAGSGAPGRVPAQVPAPQTLEGVLARQLVTGAITRPQYRQSMGSIAVRDAQRHPFRVPGDLDPPERA